MKKGFGFPGINQWHCRVYNTRETSDTSAHETLGSQPTWQRHTRGGVYGGRGGFATAVCRGFDLLTIRHAFWLRRKTGRQQQQTTATTTIGGLKMRTIRHTNTQATTPTQPKTHTRTSKLTSKNKDTHRQASKYASKHTRKQHATQSEPRKQVNNILLTLPVTSS